MKVIEVKTIDVLEVLYNCSAMTWEGLAEECFEQVLETCSVDQIAYLMKGSVANDLMGLTGRNAYPDDLNIFSIPHFKGLACQHGARWMDDIVDNNLEREEVYLSAEELFS